MAGVIFYVHCNIINEPGMYESLYHLGLASICVQFYWIADLLDLLAKGDKVSIQSWLSTRDDHSIQEPFAPFQKFVDGLAIQTCIPRQTVSYKVRIVAIRAVKVAPRKKEDTAYFPRIIDQRVLLHSSQTDLI